MRVWTAQDGVLLCDGREILLRRDYRTTYAEGAAEVQWIADACNAAELGSGELRTGSGLPAPVRFIEGAAHVDKIDDNPYHRP